MYAHAVCGSSLHERHDVDGSLGRVRKPGHRPVREHAQWSNARLPSEDGDRHDTTNLIHWKSHDGQKDDKAGVIDEARTLRPRKAFPAAPGILAPLMEEVM